MQLQSSFGGSAENSNSVLGAEQISARLLALEHTTWSWRQIEKTMAHSRTVYIIHVCLPISMGTVSWEHNYDYYVFCILVSIVCLLSRLFAGIHVCKAQWLNLLGIGKSRIARCKNVFKGTDLRSITGPGGISFSINTVWFNVWLTLHCTLRIIYPAHCHSHVF